MFVVSLLLSISLHSPGSPFLVGQQSKALLPTTLPIYQNFATASEPTVLTLDVCLYYQHSRAAAYDRNLLLDWSFITEGNQRPIVTYPVPTR